MGYTNETSSKDSIIDERYLNERFLNKRTGGNMLGGINMNNNHLFGINNTSPYNSSAVNKKYVNDNFIPNKTPAQALTRATGGVRSAQCSNPEMTNFGRHLRKYAVRLLRDYKVEFIERFLEK